MNIRSTRSLLATLATIFWVIGLGTCAIGAHPASATTGAVLILTGSAFMIGLAIINTLVAITRKPDQPAPKPTEPPRASTPS